jgi:hypothetical protein
MYGLEAVGVAYIETDEENDQDDVLTVMYQRRPTMAEFSEAVTAAGCNPRDWTELYNQFFEGSDFLDEHDT